MRLIRPTMLAAVGTAALTSLAGCGLTSGDGDHASTAPATQPSVTASASAAQDATADQTPDQTATDQAPTAAPTGPSQSADATPSSDAVPSSAPAVTGPASAPVVRYNDKTGLLQLPVSNASLPGSPAGLRDFARTRLKQMWHDQFQNAAGCEGVAQIQVKRASTAAAFVQAGWGEMTPTCPQYAGNPSSWEIWGDEGGTWSLVLTGEGLASCTDLASRHIPRAIYPTCSDGSHKVPNPVA